MYESLQGRHMPPAEAGSPNPKTQRPQDSAALRPGLTAQPPLRGSVDISSASTRRKERWSGIPAKSEPRERLRLRTAQMRCHWNSGEKRKAKSEWRTANGGKANDEPRNQPLRQLAAVAVQLAELFWRTRGGVLVRRSGRRRRGDVRQQVVERFQPQHLRLKDAPEVARSRGCSVLHADGLLQFSLDRRYRLAGQPAGDDQGEVVEVGRHVQREAVRGDAARDVYADGGNL